jgi:CRISPR-associated protein Csd1
MLLQKLREYSERLDLPPALYSRLAVHYVIDLDMEGRFIGMIDTADTSTPRTSRGALRLVPEVQKTSGIKAQLLCENASYVLGYVGESANPDRVTRSHNAFKERVARCAADTHEPAVKAVERYLDNEPLSHTALPEGFVPEDRITFRVEGVYPVDLPRVREFWANDNNPELAGTPVMQCVVCGQLRPVLPRLQGKIRGVPGGQINQAIISAQGEAFWSYGLENSLIAPTCADCGERFTKAANELLATPTSRRAMAGAAFIYWTREPVQFDLMALFNDPSQQEVSALLDSVYGGRRPPDLDSTRLYATILSGSGGRATVRDWIDTTVGEVKSKLALWFQRQLVVDAYGEGPRPLGLTALAGATVRDLSDVPRPMTRSLLRAALTGTPLPLDLLYQAVRRIRAQQERDNMPKVTRAQAALIKLVIRSHGPDSQEDTMVQLDPDNTNAAYRCGRLLAVLEEVQRLAIPGANATIIDRFFGTASSAPASVFGRLLRGAQPHLAKLERDRRGAYVALQRRLEEIQGGLALQRINGRDVAFPRTLRLEDQGLFALGYYHQRAFDRAQAREAAERRRAGTADEPDADLEINN